MKAAIGAGRRGIDKPDAIRQRVLRTALFDIS